MEAPLSPALISLLAFVVWTVLLVAVYVTYRTGLVLAGRRRADDFPADAPHEGADVYKRLIRAHLNCVENLPLFAAVVLTAAVAGRLPAVDGPAPWYLALRIAQSTIHVIAVNPATVTVRAGLFFGQLVLLGVMVVRLAVG